MTWMFIKTILMIAVIIWQFFIVYNAESLAKETGDYGLAIYELIWLFILFYIGDSILKEDDK